VRSERRRQEHVAEDDPRPDQARSGIDPHHRPPGARRPLEDRLRPAAQGVRSRFSGLAAGGGGRERWPLRITKDEREIAMSVLAKTGAASLANAQMRDLSGGETQRVFLARALATKPTLLILDEPTAGVDVSGRAAIVDLMAEISGGDAIAAILVTHNLQAIARCAERVVYLERSLKAWGLWTELSADRDLSAIQIASGDHRAMAMDSD